VGAGKWILAVGAGVGAYFLFRGEGAAAATSQRAQYKPGAPETVELFRNAALWSGMPVQWADHPGLHYILRRETHGWVGRPNCTYNSVHGADFCREHFRHRWPLVWDELRAGVITARSSACGLGQLLLRNQRRFMPSGPDGLGNALEEAIGMLRYIQNRYGDPQTAYEFYINPNKPHEGY